MVIDSRQKRFVKNMQLRQCFGRAKPFRLKKSRKVRLCLFFLFPKKKCWKKTQFQNLASKKPNRQPCYYCYCSVHPTVAYTDSICVFSTSAKWSVANKLSFMTQGAVHQSTNVERDNTKLCAECLAQFKAKMKNKATISRQSDPILWVKVTSSVRVDLESNSL